MYSLIDTIGNTPIVKLRLNDLSIGNVFAKLELQNYFGMKDRVAKHAILDAIRTGELLPGAPIIESSSGTMACGVALVGRALGHDVHIVTDPRLDRITHCKLTSLGCHVHIVNKMGKYGWQSARLDKLRSLMEKFPGAYWPRQYDNPNNPLAYEMLATEVMESIGHVDILIAPVGSGGSLSGTAKALQKNNPKLRVIAVDATGSVVFGQPDNPNRLQSGLGNSLIAANVDFSIIDEVHWMNDEEAFAATLELAKYEQVFAGNSSGSTYAVARWISSQVNADTNIVAIFPDRGDRYVDTIYNGDFRAQHGINGLKIPVCPNEVAGNRVVQSWSYKKLR